MKITVYVDVKDSSVERKEKVVFTEERLRQLVEHTVLEQYGMGVKVKAGLIEITQE